MKYYRLITLLIIGIVFLFPFLTIPNARSQPPVPEQATKELDRAISEEIEKKLMVPPKKPPEIEEKVEEEEGEGPVFFIKKIKLLGVESFPEEDFKPIVEKYEERTVTLSELNALAKEIEREYLKKGVIAACIVPPQEIKEGLVTLHIIEGKMGKLKIKDHRYFSKDRLSYYWGIKPGEVLRYDKIYRNLQFMNKNPDRHVTSTLRAGKEPETVDVALDAETNFPIHITASFDREGGASTGKLRKGIGFVNNNFLGLDDTLLGGYTGGKHFGGIYVYHKLPITNYGTSILYGYSKMRAFSKKDYESDCISSNAETASFFLHQDLYQKERYIGEIKAGVEGKNKNVAYRAGTMAHDRLRIIRIGGLLMDRGPGSIAYLKPVFSQGLNFLGARRRNDYSSRDASNTFSKATLETSFRKALIAGFQTSLKFHGQVAGEQLMSQEEFFMGGINSIRGYPDADFLADTGFYANAELLVPAFMLPKELKFPYASKPLKDEITGVLFVDYGYGEKRNASATELGRRKFTSLGTGVRIRLFDQALLRLEWGWPVDTMANLPVTEFSRSRFHFSLDFQDKIPDELERVYRLMEEENIKHGAWSVLNKEMKNKASPLRKKIHRYFYLARKGYKEGDLQQAKEYYEKVVTIGRSAHRQVENYIRETVKQRKELNEYTELAARYYKRSKFKKAREIWEKIKEEAKIKPLVIETL